MVEPHRLQVARPRNPAPKTARQPLPLQPDEEPEALLDRRPLRRVAAGRHRLAHEPVIDHDVRPHVCILCHEIHIVNPPILFTTEGTKFTKEGIRLHP